MHDGPYTIFYAVDPKARKRVAYWVTERGSAVETARQFLIQLQTYPLVVMGVTTDGSHIYPPALAEVFPGARHQVCRFHVLHEMVLLACRVLASVRKLLRTQLPRRPRGRQRSNWTAEQKRLEHQRQVLRQKITDLWENRRLFVQHDLSPSERATLKRLTRGHPELRLLRELVEQVYRLFDRRCSAATAIKKLQQLRHKRLFVRFPILAPLVRKLQSPNLEKALEFLDDDLLESTSNAAERANRRHRKMQKTVYRFRCRRMIEARIAIDMLLDYQRRTRASPTPISSSDKALPRAVA